MWFTQPQQIADSNGQPTGRWRMTATSDEGGGGPFGDTSHDHGSAEEAQACDQCDEFVSRATGFPSQRARKRQQELEAGAAKAKEDATRELLTSWERTRCEVSEPDLDDEQPVHVTVSLGVLRRLRSYSHRQ